MNRKQRSNVYLARSCYRVITTDASSEIILFLNNIGNFSTTEIGYEKSDANFMGLWDIGLRLPFWILKVSINFYETWNNNKVIPYKGD